MKSFFSIFLLMALVGLSVSARAASDEEEKLSKTLLGKQLFLRGFDANTQMIWRWENDSLKTQEPIVHTLGVLIPSSVKINNDKVEVMGERHTLLRKGDKQYALSGGKDHVRIEVDLAGADRTMLLSKLPSLLFYPDMASMLADVPQEHRDLLPARDKPQNQAKIPQDCDCADLSERCSPNGFPNGLAGVKPPLKTSKLEMTSTDEVKSQRAKGNVEFDVRISDKGEAGDIWVVMPSGMGMDEVAGEALVKAKFSSATCHDKPVTSAVMITIGYDYSGYSDR